MTVKGFANDGDLIVLQKVKKFVKLVYGVIFVEIQWKILESTQNPGKVNQFRWCKLREKTLCPILKVSLNDVL